MVTKEKQRNKKQKKSAAKSTQVAVIQPEIKATRQVLMMKAKERGIKNFRILNKEELGLVLTDGATPEQIKKVVSTAVARWKSGWGSRKNKL